jgi:CubicO group peptidase (beta-lactamase class C family)
MSSEALAHELTPAQIAALVNPPLDPLIANDPAWQAAQIPSANGFATARGIAELYEGFLAARHDPARWAAGFLRNSSGAYGPNEAAFGHSGWGGSFAFADPERGWAMAYTMNRMGADLIGDPRNQAIVDALYRSPIRN